MIAEGPYRPGSSSGLRPLQPIQSARWSFPQPGESQARSSGFPQPRQKRSAAAAFLPHCVQKQISSDAFAAGVLNDEPASEGTTLHWDFIELEEAYRADAEAAAPP